ncbi:MAG TPA: hypothetical protein VFZ65_04185 [Planctomycetota bacterium]|nr:hypothetical protein [Planctomycetota bacterium]
MNVRHAIWAGACLLFFAGCGDVGPANDEVAAELRALRAVLVQQSGQGHAGLAPDRGEITSVMQPLREALDGIVLAQREQQARQLELTQELQRWSQLVVEGASGARREQGESLVQRLQQLEAAMHEQDARHREAETLLQGALDRTADRLDDFLRRLGEVAPPSGPARASDAAPAKVPEGAAPPPVPGAGTPGAGNGGEAGPVHPGGQARLRWPNPIWWWALAAAASACLGVLFFRRLRRLPRASGEAPPEVEAVEQLAGAAGGDAEEIWAAAALLGEAVGRLRQSAAEPGVAADAAALVAAAGGAQGEDMDGLDVFVLGDAVPDPEPAAAPAPELPEVRRDEAAQAVAPARAHRPTSVVLRLAATDAGAVQAAVLQVLRDDPRVLRRPEPTVRAARGMLELHFDVLPDLPSGERSHLEQRLRDAVA